MTASIEPGTIRPYRDLRDYMEIVDALGELRCVQGADMDIEIGAIAARSREGSLIPMVLCDHILGLESGFRMLLNPVNSLNRAALLFGLPLRLARDDYKRLGPAKWRSITPVPPVVVEDGPVLANTQQDGEVDLRRFPRPLWHVGDGGAYIGTGCAVITKDPDTGWVNVGTYRVMYQDPTHVSVFMNVSRHGRMHVNAHLRQGKACPIAISLGHDPLLFAMACHAIPEGAGEYDYVGGVRGEPMEVIVEPRTGLPIPARAELVLVGEINPSDIRLEGPFGEWTGYYGAPAQELPTVAVRAVYFRDDPIMLCDIPPRPPHRTGGSYLGILSGEITLERLRRSVPGVKDVYSFPSTGGYLAAVSIQQQYAGHAKEAGLCLIQGHSHRPRYGIVVDDDVNIRDLEEVMWVMCTRSDPARDVDIITRCQSTPIDPMVPPWETNFLMSRAIIDATRPYEWIDRFPKTVDVAPELMRQVERKWPHVFE